MPDNTLLCFYAGTGPNSRGHFLKEIHAWTDNRLELDHNFIQWLFPTDEESATNPAAPVLDAETIKQFRSKRRLRIHLQTSLDRMLRFYGLEMRANVPSKVVCAPNFSERAGAWITPKNHNHLRITRILKSLRLVGLETNATAFYECLVDICGEEARRSFPGISHETFRFWRSAAGAHQVLPVSGRAVS